MANMSYCRFENTARDLQDCRDALDEGADLESVSADEARAMIRLIRLCREITYNHGHLLEG